LDPLDPRKIAVSLRLCLRDSTVPVEA
jgi:hypothetical protein